MKLYFPSMYDIKYLIKDIRELKDSGLNKLSNEIKI